MRQLTRWVFAACLMVAATAAPMLAQQRPALRGRVTDETGGVLPGVRVELRNGSGLLVATAQTNATGEYVFADVVPATYQASFVLVNFSTLIRPAVTLPATAAVDVVMHLAVNADVTVVAREMFQNLAEVTDPAENLIGVAQSASQGAITSRQLELRPIQRQAEVLETVPGLIVTQHSGEGKANQYFLRGFNLDHGSDFSVTVAGTPVNIPTHAHSQGYSDLNFLIPELVAGVQFSKGPYFAEHGDFATAGASTITYANTVNRPTIQVELGGFDYRRALLLGSRRVGRGQALGALEVSTNSGPWTVPDAFNKLNGVFRYSQGNAVNGFTVTFMGYRGRWNATEASPSRAVNAGLIGRFDSIDETDGGRSSRVSVATEWQRGHGTTLTKVTAYAIAYRLTLFSNFTFFLDDPDRGDQREQTDRRWVTGGRVSRRTITQWFGQPAEVVVGAQVRSDAVPSVALYHTEARRRLETLSANDVNVFSAGTYVAVNAESSRWLRWSAGMRVDASRFSVTALDPWNSGTRAASIVSPKASLTAGPWHRSELYVNAGTGFHSNNALGTVLTRDPQGEPVEPVTPLVRATGAEFGLRSVIVPHLQTTISVWTLHLASELVYNGDVGATEPGPASRRHGIEIANYYRPMPWLVADLDLSFSRARFDDGARVPEAVGSVVSAGLSAEGRRGVSGGVRWRYFGPRTLVEDGSVTSKATSLMNVDAAWRLTPRVRVEASLFNALNARHSDIDYYFASRLPNEPPDGVDDIHFHPVIPRTLRVTLALSF